jgi:RNA polymerase sigma-70 factor (ECF subfamily)
MDELQLRTKLKNGDREAFRQAVEKYQSFILNCSFKFVRSRETAEDITQEVFLEMWSSIHSFRGDAKLSTWLYRIAIAKSLNHVKSLQRKKRFGIIVNIFETAETNEQLPPSGDPTPEEQLVIQERAMILQQALDHIPENQRVAFTLSKYEYLRHEEIAEIMAVSTSSVESLIHRAKENLRKKLTGYYRHHLK